MLFELHITIGINGPGGPGLTLERWKDFCEAKGAKPLDIRLHEHDAKHPRQVMFAVTIEGSPAQARYWQDDWQRAVNTAGFVYTRVKLEVPLDKSRGYDVDYYETHVKALVPDNMLSLLETTAKSEGWAVSSNALYAQDDGLNKVYLTKRVDGRGDLYQAAAYFREAFQDAGWTAFCHTVRMESEAVISDSNPYLDKNWA